MAESWPLWRLGVDLTLVGPILTQGSTMREPGIDAPMARDGQGRPMLPYSLVKGKVRDALDDLGADPADMKAWFGTAPADGVFDPDRGRLHFTDFATTTAERADDPVIERIEIDDQTGTAAGRMLAMLEAPFGYGQAVVFEGAVEFFADKEEAERIEAQVTQALAWCPAYGAERTVGFGRTQGVETKLKEVAAAALVVPTTAPKDGDPTASDPNRLVLRLRFDRPLCVGGRRHSDNRFDSLAEVPGAVLKGALARMLLERAGRPHEQHADDRLPEPWRALGQHFWAVRVAHAVPMAEKTDATGAAELRRPVRPPLSLITSPKRPKELFDAALLDGARLIGRAAPAFAPDWKKPDEKVVETAFGLEWPAREVRVRTAIDAATGRADDRKLFSYSMVRPDGFVWETAVDLNGVPESDRPAVGTGLLDLLSLGLRGVGKTRARTAVERGVKVLEQPAPPAHAEALSASDGVHIVTLQTDFLMTDPDRLERADADALFDAYQDFWHEASGESLKLVRFFARQALHGGYLARRYGRPAANSYEPFLLTDAGSTFVLKRTGKGDPATAVDGWRRAGLPLPKWVATRYGGPEETLWRRCPFVPQNGYGAVAVDLQCHRTMRPPEE